MLDQRVDDVDAELKLRAAAKSNALTTAVPQIHGWALQNIPEEQDSVETSGSEGDKNEAPQCVTADEMYEGIGLFEDLSLRAIGVTSEERKRCRDNSLCYYCGEGGHYMKECPKARKQIQANSSTSARGISIIMPDDGANFLADLLPENY